MPTLMVDAHRLPLVVIVGPTASGKTAAAIELALQIKGEIICADSRTIYKGMDIGTAKPSDHERSGVPHWGLDLVEPGQRFTAADFQKYCYQKIAEIRARGAVPIIVGGTGLYVDAVIYQYTFSQHNVSPERRQELDAMTVQDLKMLCKKHKYNLPVNENNKRHLVATITSKGNTSEKKGILKDTIVVGIATDKEVLHTRIRKRAEQMFSSNVVEEAMKLASVYGWESEAMTGNIYPIIRKLACDELTMGQAIEQFTIADRQLAKRQMTWFKRSEDIHWLPVNEVVRYCIEKINASE